MSGRQLHILMYPPCMRTSTGHSWYLLVAVWHGFMPDRLSTQRVCLFEEALIRMTTPLNGLSAPHHTADFLMIQPSSTVSTSRTPYPIRVS